MIETLTTRAMTASRRKVADDVCAILATLGGGAAGDADGLALSAEMDAVAVEAEIGAAFFAAARRICGTVENAETLLPRCRERYFATAGHSGHLLRRAEWVGEAFASADIPVVLLKGVALARWSYADAGARPMVDIDLLVPPQEIGRGEELLRRLGYQICVSRRHERDARRWLHHLPEYRHPQHGDVIELHHGLVPPSAKVCIESAALWADVRPIAAGAGVYVLSPADQFLHVMLHLLYSSPIVGRLRQLLDLHVLASAAGGNPAFWKRVTVRARQFGLEDWLGAAVELTRRVFGTYVPPLDLGPQNPAPGVAGRSRIAPEDVAQYERAICAVIRGEPDKRLAAQLARRKMWLERPTFAMGLRLAVSAARRSLMHSQG